MLKRLPVRHLLTIFVPLLAACSNGAWADGTSVDSRVSHHEEVIAPPDRELWLFVLDDAATPAARTLREQVASSVRLPEGVPRTASGSVCAGDAMDTAHSDPIDVQVVVVRPSQGVNSWTTASERSGLAWCGERDDVSAYNDWLAAVRTELGREPSTNEAATYSSIEAIHSALASLSADRASATTDEQRIIEARGATHSNYVRVFVATSRDDASPLAVSMYPIVPYQQLDANSPFAYELRTLLLPANSGEPAAIPDELLATTFPRWHEFTSSLETGVTYFPSSTAEDLFGSHRLSATLIAPCWGAEPVRNPDRSANCRVHVVTDDVGTCDASRGWLDPVVGDPTNGTRAPEYELNPDGTRQRVCEIRQLSGDSLAECLDQPDSAPTSAGWCYPEPSDACRQRCPSGQVPIAFRFTGGSSRADSSRLRLRYDCLIDPGR